MKDPRNNPDKWLRPNEPFTQEEKDLALARLISRECGAGRKRELDAAVAEYEWSTGR